MRIRTTAVVALCSGLMALAAAAPAGARAMPDSSGTCEPAWGNVAGANDTAFDRNHLGGVSARSDDDALAVGFSASDIGPGPDALGEHWDGSSWSLVTTPTPNGEAELDDVHFVGSDDALAVGETYTGAFWQTLAERWDGSSFSRVTTPNGSTAPGAINDLNDVGGVATDTWAVGSVYTGSGPLRPLILRFDGTSWSKLADPANPGSGNYSLWGVSEASSSSAWAVGYDDNGTREVPMVVRWNGTAWAVVSGVPSPGSGDSQLLSVRALSSTNVWAVGYYSTSGGTRTLVLHFDGSAWSRVSSPSPSSQNALRSVTVRSARDAWAVGFTHSAGNPTDSLVLHYDGTSWRQVSSPSPAKHSDLFSVDTVSGGSDVWAVGEANGAFTARICPVRVSDAGVAPAAARVSVGSAVAWAFPTANTLDHSVTDDSGLALFDSGPEAPGGSYVHTFTTAGTHRIIDTADGDTSSIEVTPTSVPKKGGSTTSFQVAWATNDASPPYAYDVQVEGPADGSYVTWFAGTTDDLAAFVPGAWQGGEGAGTYRIRARFRDTDTGEATDWSPPVKITVS